jgi:hypothetical protein
LLNLLEICSKFSKLPCEFNKYRVHGVAETLNKILLHKVKMSNSIESQVFGYLSQTPESSNQIPEFHPKLLDYGVFVQQITDTIFPTQLEDVSFFLSVWHLIEGDFSNWYMAETYDGANLIQCMIGAISVNSFITGLRRKDFLSELRKEIYRVCFTTNTDDSKIRLLEVMYKRNNVLTLSHSFYASNPDKYTDSCAAYYKNLDYSFRDGIAINNNSIFVLTRKDLVPLTPSTFNLGVLPWDLDQSISLQVSNIVPETVRDIKKFGWSKYQLVTELSNLGKDLIENLSVSQLTSLYHLYYGIAPPTLERVFLTSGILSKDISTSGLHKLTKQQLISLYRSYFGTDGYINWDLVQKYRYISKRNLKTIAFETFGQPRDLFEDSDYDELVNKLRVMSLASLEIVKKAKYLINNAIGTTGSKTYKGLAHILRAQSESINKSFWYPDFSGKMNLMYQGNPIPDSLIPITYDTYIWACERSDEISLGYFVMIAQRIGIWNLITDQMDMFNSQNICSRIASLLTEFSEEYDSFEDDVIDKMNAATNLLKKDFEGSDFDF